MGHDCPDGRGPPPPPAAGWDGRSAVAVGRPAGYITDTESAAAALAQSAASHRHDAATFQVTAWQAGYSLLWLGKSKDTVKVKQATHEEMF